MLWFKNLPKPVLDGISGFKLNDRHVAAAAEPGVTRPVPSYDHRVMTTFPATSTVAGSTVATVPSMARQADVTGMD